MPTRFSTEGVTCKPVYWSERDDWTLAMVAAGLGFAFMPVNFVKHLGVVALPVVEPEFWRQVSLVSVRGRRYSPAVGSLVREAMRKTWFGHRPERVKGFRHRARAGGGRRGGCIGGSDRIIFPAALGEPARASSSLAGGFNCGTNALNRPRAPVRLCIDGGYRINCE